MVPAGLEPTVSLRSVNEQFLQLLPPLAAQEKLPHRCERCAQKNQPVSDWLSGASRTRTYDPIDVNDVLYRLSHGTISLSDIKYDTTYRAKSQALKYKIAKKVRPVKTQTGCEDHLNQSTKDESP